MHFSRGTQPRMDIKERWTPIRRGQWRVDMGDSEIAPSLSLPTRFGCPRMKKAWHHKSNESFERTPAQWAEPPGFEIRWICGAGH